MPLIARRLLLAWVLLGGRALAADDEPEVEVIVHDDARGSESKRDPSAASTVVKKERLDRPGADAADVLARVAGVQVSRSGTVSELSTASVRGATSAQTPIYLAGIRLNDDLTGTADLSRVPLWMLDRVEVFRGSAPEDADRLGIGGAVFFEPRLPRRTRVGGGGGFGSYGERSVWMGGEVASDGSGALVAVRRDSANNDYTYLDDRGTAFESGDDRAAHPRQRRRGELGFLGDLPHPARPWCERHDGFECVRPRSRCDRARVDPGSALTWANRAHSGRCDDAYAVQRRGHLYPRADDQRDRVAPAYPRSCPRARALHDRAHESRSSRGTSRAPRRVAEPRAETPGGWLLGKRGTEHRSTGSRGPPGTARRAPSGCRCALPARRVADAIGAWRNRVPRHGWAGIGQPLRRLRTERSRWGRLSSGRASLAAGECRTLRAGAHLGRALWGFSRRFGQPRSGSGECRESRRRCASHLRFEAHARGVPRCVCSGALRVRSRGLPPLEFRRDLGRTTCPGLGSWASKSLLVPRHWATRDSKAPRRFSILGTRRRVGRSSTTSSRISPGSSPRRVSSSTPIQGALRIASPLEAPWITGRPATPIPRGSSCFASSGCSGSTRRPGLGAGESGSPLRWRTPSIMPSSM